MDKRWWLLLILVIITVCAVWLWPDKAETQETARTSQPAKGEVPFVEQTQAISKAAADQGDQQDELVEDPYADEAIRAQLLQVADLYAETSKYPHTSQPIRNPDLAKEPKPFAETEVDVPFPVDGLDEPIRLLAAVDRYQYFAGDRITVRLHVVGAPADTFVQANAVISGAQGDTPLVATLDAADETLTSFNGRFDTRVVPPSLMSTEMLIKLQVQIGEETLFTSVPFRYSQASAQLVAVPYVRQEAENLVIALQYTVFQPGYYFAKAILEDAQTGQPLIQLQGENRLNQGNSNLLLRAHIGALRAMGSEGPYVLRSVSTYRGAEDGEPFDVPASSASVRFEIQGFPFDQYDDIPHQDEQAEARLEFLRNLGADNN